MIMTMKSMSNEESLQVITSMIEAARKDMRDNGSWFLLWGWLVFIACVAHFTLMMVDYDKPWLAWMLMIVGGVISAFKGIKEDRHQRVKTYIDSFMNYVLVAFLVSLFLVLLNMQHLGLSTYPMVMMVYGIWLFVSGGVLEFRPLIYGGILNWILAFVAFQFNFDFQIIILAAAVLFGYIIPGYLLRSRYVKAERDSLSAA
jgi:hypothetical protein